MDTILRSMAMYVLIVVTLRITGKRSLNQITTFDFVLLLILSESTQQVLVGNDYSFTNAGLAILTLVFLDLIMTILKDRSPKLDLILGGTPLVVVANGQPVLETMRKERVDISDILEEARRQQGLERLDQIKWAVLERGGAISIIPQRGA